MVKDMRLLKGGLRLVVMLALTTASTSAYAVSHGDDDSSNLFPYTVFVSSSNGTVSGNCSGVLVSPTWVLTANHCITGARSPQFPIPCTQAWAPTLWSGNTTTNISFDQSNINPPTQFPDFTHTTGRSGEVLVRQDFTINSCSHLDSSLDLALVKLDKRVPISRRAPLHPPIAGLQGCTELMGSDVDDFPAMLIGYGPTDPSFLVASEATDDDDPFPHRNFNDSDDWFLDPVSNSSEAGYSNTWDSPPILGPLGISTVYTGPLHGDSGGPMVILPVGPSLPILCGIASRFYPRINLSILSMGATYAAVDSAPNRAFLQSILDSKGRFMGECDEGPVEGRDIDSDEDLIPDSCDVCPFSPARDASGQNTYDLSGGGPDGDEDGIPDVCDNCPTDFNPSQADSNHDGLGDACDLCDLGPNNYLPGLSCCTFDPMNPLDVSQCGAGNICVPVATEANHPAVGLLPAVGCAARCARGLDDDGDKVGNSCDNCTKVFNPAQEDNDGDGVGNFCDNCPGTSADGVHAEDVNPTCTQDAVCHLLNPNSVCAPTFTGDGYAHCTLLADADQDGVGDVCDNCANTANKPGPDGTQANCNLHTEIALGDAYPYKGDACDSAPCSYLDVVDNNTTWEANVDQWAKLSYSPTLLTPNQPGGYTVQQSNALGADVGLRTCQCASNDPLSCNFLGGCPISTAEYSLPNGAWKTPNLVPGTFNGAPPSTPPASFASQATITDVGVCDPNWSLPAPATSAGFYPAGTSTGYADWDLGSPVAPPRQILWTHTTNVAGLQNAAAAAAAFANRSNHYLTGTFGVGPQLSKHPELIPLGSGCGPIDWICPQCRMQLDNLNWLIDPIDHQLIARGAIREFDLTMNISSTLIAEMQAATGVWLSPAETMIGFRHGGPQLAVVAADGSGIGFAAGSTDGAFMGSMPVSNIAGPPARTAFGATLSGTEQAVFVIGGYSIVREGGVEPSVPMHDAWYYGFQTGQWTNLPLSGALPDKVLAVTYRAEDRSLYVVDEPDGSVPAVARLLRIDIGSGTSSVVGSWTRHAAMDKVFIGNAPRGNLFLLGSSTSTQQHVGVMLQLDGPSGPLAVVGGTSGAFEIAFQPTLTDRGLTLPVPGSVGPPQEVCVSIQRGTAGAVEDAVIDGNATGTNTGASASLTAQADGFGVKHALLHFNLEGVPSDATITSATLGMSVSSGNGPVLVHRITAPWSESTVTWSNFGSAFSIYDTEATLTSGPAALATITDLVSGWSDGSIPNNGVLLEQVADGNTSFGSSEASLGNRPYLSVCYVPGARPVDNKFVTYDAVTINTSHTVAECL